MASPSGYSVGMPLTPAWYQDKADSLVHAWRMDYGDDPTLRGVTLALSVAIFETRAGDAWPSEHNWGATTLRALNAAEKAAVRAAGIFPTVGAGHPERAKAAQAAIVAAGLPLPQGNIHCDSAPGIGAYFVWFASFPNDVEGAAYFLKLLAGLTKPKAARAVLTSDTGTEVQLATAMYFAGYYTGFYKKTSLYAFVDAKWTELAAGALPPAGAQTKRGSDLNIAAYASGLQRITPGIKQALATWHMPSGEPTEDPAPDLDVPTAPTEPAPPLIPWDLDWDELTRARDGWIKDH